MQTRFTLRQLEYLVAVGRFGSITLAAEHLSVSPPSISNAISLLEAEFGLPLFVRKHAHGMSLTQSGQDLVAEAAKALTAAKAVSNLADLHKGTVQGELNLGCLLTFAQILVPRLRKAYSKQFPEVRFRQFQLHQADLIDALRGATLDIALTYDLAIPTDLAFDELAVLPPFAILPKTHLLAARSSVTMADLAPFPMILLDLPLSTDYFRSLFDLAGVAPQLAEKAKDMAVVHALVGNDFGYSIANTRPHSTMSPDGKPLCFVPISGPVKSLRMGLLAPIGGTSSLTVKALVDLFKAELTDTILSEITVRLPVP